MKHTPLMENFGSYRQKVAQYTVYNTHDVTTLLWIDDPGITQQGAWWTLIKGGSISVSYGASPDFPTSPNHGDLFFDSVTRDSYIYDGKTWKLITSVDNYSQGDLPNWKGSLSAAPDSPSEGWAYHDETSDLAYTYSDGKWKVISLDGQSIMWLGSLWEKPLPPSPDAFSDMVFRDARDGNVYTWFNSSFWRVGNFLEIHYVAPQT